MDENWSVRYYEAQALHGSISPRVQLIDVTTAPTSDGRKLLRLEVRNAETPIERKPEWIKTRAKMGLSTTSS